LGWGYAKGRSPVAWELRPHDRSRCAEHGEGVPAPPGVVILALPTVPRNAERAQRESRAKGRGPKAPATVGVFYCASSSFQTFGISALVAHAG
jgi:hypothetical protein